MLEKLETKTNNTDGFFGRLLCDQQLRTSAVAKRGIKLRTRTFQFWRVGDGVTVTIVHFWPSGYFARIRGNNLALFPCGMFPRDHVH